MEESKFSNLIIRPIEVDPPEIVFTEVVPSKVFTAKFKLINNLKILVNVSIKTSATDKLDVKPRELKLDSQKAVSVEVTLRLSKPFGERFGTKIPIKEFIFVKTENFDQKIDVLILPYNAKPLPSKYLSNSSLEDKAEPQENMISNEEFETLISAEPGRLQEYNSNQTNYDASKDDPSHGDGEEDEKIINSDVKSEGLHSHHSSYPNHELIQH